MSCTSFLSTLFFTPKESGDEEFSSGEEEKPGDESSSDSDISASEDDEVISEEDDDAPKRAKRVVTKAYKVCV